MTFAFVAVTVAAGLGVGILAALFGVGGGLLMVPYIVFFLERTQHVAEGTSLAVIVPTAIVGVISHSRRGYVSWKTALLLATGGVFGAVVGARVALETPGELLEALFGVFVICVGIRFITQGLRNRASDPR